MTTLIAKPVVRYSLPEVRGRSRLVAWLPAVVAVAGVTAILATVGATWADIVSYAVYVGWGLTLPGTLVYRALRGAPHSLVDDLAMGTAAGFALEIAAWAGFSAAGQVHLLGLWPVAVIAVFAVVPGLRRHWRTPIGCAVPPAAWSWVVAATVVAAAGYVIVALAGGTPPVPTGSGAFYNIDTTYLLALVGEAKHHFPLLSPSIASDAVHYHYFAYAHEASASLISGVDTPVVYIQLASPVIVSVAVVLLAVAGWRVAGNPWVGALAAVAMFVVGEACLAPMGTVGAVFNYYGWVSPSLPYGWMFTFALLAMVTSVLQGRSRSWPLIALYCLAAAGSKATILPAVGVGLACVAAFDLVRRRRPGRDVLVLGAITAAAAGFALVVLFHFEVFGLTFGPLAAVLGPLPSGWVARAYVIGIVGVGFVVYLLARVAGIAVLARRVMPWDRTEWFLAGAFAAGVAGTVLLRHPFFSQNFFISSAYGFGAVLSAMGFLALVGRHRLSTRVVVTIVGGVVLTAVVVVTAVARWPDLDVIARLGLPGYWPITDAVVLYGAVAAVGMLVVWGWRAVARARLRPGPRRGIAAMVALSGLMFGGAPILTYDLVLRGTADEPVYAVLVTPDQVAAATWLRDHSGPDDLVATNEHVLGNGSSLVFWLPAFSERRELIGSWQYAPRLVEGAFGAGLRNAPFWDQQLLSDNDIVFTDPTDPRLEKLRDTYGVRWLVVNRTVQRESAQLAFLTRLRYESGAIAVYQLYEGR